MQDEKHHSSYNIRRTIKLATEGAYSKATEALRSTGVLTTSGAVLAALTEKHRQATPSNEKKYQSLLVLPSGLKVSEESVLMEVNKFALGSSAGGSGYVRLISKSFVQLYRAGPLFEA